MANILRRVGVDVPEPLRRLLEGDFDSWLRVEEYREGNALVVKAEVPGIDPEKDVEITLLGNQLHIDVRREEKSEHKGKEGYRSEFRYGTFSRSVTLLAESAKTTCRPPTRTGFSKSASRSPKSQPPARGRSPSVADKRQIQPEVGRAGESIFPGLPPQPRPVAAPQVHPVRDLYSSSEGTT